MQISHLSQQGLAGKLPRLLLPVSCLEQVAAYPAASGDVPAGPLHPCCLQAHLTGLTQIAPWGGQTEGKIVLQSLS